MPQLPGVGRYEPRGALWASISVGGADVQVINTHLGLRSRERHKQIDELLGPDWLGHPECRNPVVLVGDFNAPPGSRSYLQLTARLHDAQRSQRGRGKPTFPARFPALRIAYAFVGPAINVRRVDTVRTPLARVASDHLPLVIDLDIDAAALRLQAAQ